MKLLSIKNSGWFLIFAFGSLLTLSSPAYSSGNQVTVSDIEYNALAKINNQLNYVANSINNGISVATSSLVKFINDLVFSFDPLMPLVMTENQDLASAEKNTGSNVSEYLSDSINDFFGSSAQGLSSTFDQNPPLAEDDIPLGLSSSSVSSILASIFSSGSPAASATNYEKGNAVFNLYKLLAFNTATDDDIKNFDSTLKYIDPTYGMKVVRIGTSFRLDFSPTNSPAGTMIKTDEKNQDKSFASLKLYLSKLEDYQKYKHAYRSLLAQRIWYISNIIEPFQKRVPATKSGKSISQLEDEAINFYQQDAYFREIAKAPLGTLMRENIIINAKLLAEVHKLRLETEKMRVLAAVSNLSTLGITSINLKNQGANIEKYIYNWAHPEKKVSVGGGTAAVSQQLQQSGLAPNQ